MKLFVIGYSKCGKTPFARMLEKNCGCSSSNIEAGAWVRNANVNVIENKSEEGTRRITDWALEELRKDYNRAIDEISLHISAGVKLQIIVGIRNPHDFSVLFNPKRDVVVFLQSYGINFATDFECSGIESIHSYINFLKTVRMCGDREWFFSYFYGSEEWPDLESVVSDFQIKLCHDLLPQDAVYRDESLIHVNIPSFRAEIKEEFLYDMAASHVGKLLPCTVFAISSYPGSALTFKVKIEHCGNGDEIEDGSVFSYIPPHALVNIHSGELDPELAGIALDLEDLAYNNCPSSRVAMTTHKYLSGEVSVLFKRKNIWMSGSYILTLDWYDNNLEAHLIALSNGQYAFMPSHKIKFGACSLKDFPQFKKLHKDWKV